jgi:putative tricarboxylic transport membrane protein
MLGDRVAGLAVLALGVAYWRAASALPRPLLQQDVGPEVFPHLIGAALIVLGGLLAIGPLIGRLVGWRRREGAAAEAAPDWLAVALVLLGLVLYTALYERLGFILATVLFMAFEIGVLEGDRKRWPWLVPAVVLVPVALYVLFVKGLGVTLPAGLLRIDA